MTDRKKYNLQWGTHRLEMGVKTLVMGVVNITPDSFSDGGDFLSRDHAIAQGDKLAREGADIIDVGGESTRPFSEGVSVEEEIRRVIPVIESISGVASNPPRVSCARSKSASRSSISIRIARSPADL